MPKANSDTQYRSTLLAGKIFIAVVFGFIIAIVLYTYPYRTVAYNGPSTCDQAAPTYAMTFTNQQHDAAPLSKEASAFCQGTARYAGFPVTEHGRLKAHNGQLIDDQAYISAIGIDWLFWSAVILAGLVVTGRIKRKV